MLLRLYAGYFPLFVYLALNAGLVCYRFERVWLKVLYLISLIVLFAGYLCWGPNSLGYALFFIIVSILCVVREKAFFLIPFGLMNLFLSAPVSYWFMSGIELSDFVTIEITDNVPALLYPVDNLLGDLASLSFVFLFYVCIPWFIFKRLNVWWGKISRKRHDGKS